jgi:hypothetical protein
MSPAEQVRGLRQGFRRKGKRVIIIIMDFIWILGFLIFWLLLQLVILPKLGVDT